MTKNVHGFSCSNHAEKLKQALARLSSADKAKSMQRFFPTYVHCIGAKRIGGDLNV